MSDNTSIKKNLRVNNRQKLSRLVSNDSELDFEFFFDIDCDHVGAFFLWQCRDLRKLLLCIYYDKKLCCLCESCTIKICLRHSKIRMNCWISCHTIMDKNSGTSTKAMLSYNHDIKYMQWIISLWLFYIFFGFLFGFVLRVRVINWIFMLWTALFQHILLICVI